METTWCSWALTHIPLLHFDFTMTYYLTVSSSNLSWFWALRFIDHSWWLLYADKVILSCSTNPDVLRTGTRLREAYVLQSSLSDFVWLNMPRFTCVGLWSVAFSWLSCFDVLLLTYVLLVLALSRGCQHSWIDVLNSLVMPSCCYFVLLRWDQCGICDYASSIINEGSWGWSSCIKSI